MELEEESKKLFPNNDHHSEDESKDELSSERNQSPPSSPPLLDFPPVFTLPPTPPLPSSPTDLEMEEQDSEDDGPPPGWDNKSQHKEQMEPLVTPTVIPKISSNLNLEEQDSEDEGPPPGWDNNHQLKEHEEHKSAYSSDIKKEDERQDAQNKEGRARSLAQELISSDIKVEQQDSEDEGPPPGWDSKFQPEPERQMTCSTTPASDIKTKDVQESARNEDSPQPQLVIKTEDIQHNARNEDVPQPHSQAHPSTAPELAPSAQKDVKIEEEIFQTPTTRQHSLPPTKRQILVPKPPTPIDYPEMGQMVCGSCRHLLSYPRGARYVECACCLEENYVLEEHEVGQVICGGCNVLLMYPFGAPKVRCANCSMETEIGDQNRRPTLSEHQSRARRHLKRVHVG